MPRHPGNTGRKPRFVDTDEEMRVVAERMQKVRGDQPAPAETVKSFSVYRKVDVEALSPVFMAGYEELCRRLGDKVLGLDQLRVTYLYESEIDGIIERSHETHTGFRSRIETLGLGTSALSGQMSHVHPSAPFKGGRQRTIGVRLGPGPIKNEFNQLNSYIARTTPAARGLLQNVGAMFLPLVAYERPVGLEVWQPDYVHITEQLPHGTPIPFGRVLAGPLPEPGGGI